LYKHAGVYFMLTAEVSSIYSKGGRTYRIHNLIFSPSFKSVDKINERLGKIGNLASDGRPILGLDAAELARIIFDIDENCMIVPGHIWTPWFSVFGSMSGLIRLKIVLRRRQKRFSRLKPGFQAIRR